MKKYLIVSLFFVILLPLAANGNSYDGLITTEDNYKKIENNNITFMWKIEGDSLNIILSAISEGWIGLAFNPGFMMKKADLIIAYVEDGKVFIRDDYAKSAFHHSSDTELGGTEDITPVSGNEVNGVTTVNFTRPLVSVDEYDFNPTAGEEVTVMLAYGETDDFESIHKVAFKQKIVF